MSRLLLAPVLLAVLVTAAPAVDQPDLVLDTQSLSASTTFDILAFAPTACELQAADLCIDGPGTRKLLRFDVFAINQGPVDLVLGDPSLDPLDPHGQPLFIFSACHGHYHFNSFASYELRVRDQATLVKAGSKRAFCVEDTRAATSTEARRYDCTNQGIQAGWGDLYPSSLPCQWIDVTDVPPGDYDLWVMLNTAQLLPESDYGNDGGMTQVTIPAPGASNPIPKVRLKAPHGKKPRKVGRPLTVRWRAHVKRGVKLQDVWLSLDGGSTFSLLSGGLVAKFHSYRFVIPPEDVSTQAVVKVVVWSNDLERGVATSAPFAITP